MKRPPAPTDYATRSPTPNTVSPLGATRVDAEGYGPAEWDAPTLDAPTLGETLDELETSNLMRGRVGLETDLDPRTRHRLMLVLSTLVGIASAVLVAGVLLLFLH